MRSDKAPTQEVLIEIINNKYNFNYDRKIEHIA